MPFERGLAEPTYCRTARQLGGKIALTALTNFVCQTSFLMLSSLARLTVKTTISRSVATDQFSGLLVARSPQLLGSSPGTRMSPSITITLQRARRSLQTVWKESSAPTARIGQRTGSSISSVKSVWSSVTSRYSVDPFFLYCQPGVLRSALVLAAAKKHLDENKPLEAASQAAGVEITTQPPDSLGSDLAVFTTKILAL